MDVLVARKFFFPSIFSITISLYIYHLVYFLFLFVIINYSSAILSRGPSYGSRGKVLLAFEDNGSSKIGVRFDKSISDGNDLGGLCEDDRGFFCSGNFLSLIELLFHWLHINISYVIILACLTNLLMISTAANHLQLVDISGGDECDKIAINEIFEVVPALYLSKSSLYS